MKKYLWLVLSFLIVLVGCDLTSRDYYRSEDDFPLNGKGMLVLILDNSEISKTIDPTDPTIPGGDPTILTVNRYRISGTSTGGDSYDETDATVTGGVYTNNALEPGLWTITVETFNGHTTIDYPSGGVPIGFGQTSTPITILPDDYVTETVTILPRTDPGVLDLTIDWEMDAVPGAQVTAYLDGGAISFDVDNTIDYEATYNTSIAGGYHTFSFELFADSGATKVEGLSDSIRIISDYPTSYTWTINDLGEIVLTIDEDYKDPFGIDLPATATSITATSTSLSATTALVAADIPTDPAPTSYDYVWYIDGDDTNKVTNSHTAQTDTLSLTVSHPQIPLEPGNHNLSVVVTAYFADGFDIISSATASFTAP